MSHLGGVLQVARGELHGMAYHHASRHPRETMAGQSACDPKLDFLDAHLRLWLVLCLLSDGREGFIWRSVALCLPLVPCAFL